MKIASWNVNGIRARKEQLEAWLASEGPEILCLQEIKASPEQIPETLLEIPGYFGYWHDDDIARADIDVHPKERKAGAIGQLPEERAYFEKLLGEGQRDIARCLHPDDAEFFTWWAPWRNMRQRNIGWRIDYVLASANLAERATSCTSLREVGASDHAPLVATFDWTPASS